MSDMLFERLRQLRQRLVRLLSVYGAAWTWTVLVLGVMAIGFVDWLVHLDDPGVRFILGLVILASAGWTAWRFLVQPLRQAFTDVDLALHIERRNPGFRDSLASTVQFLQGRSDRSLGSPALQQKVIADTLRRVRGVDLDDVLDTRSIVRASCVAGAVAVALLTIVGTNFSTSMTALRRLAFPFSAGEWPRKVELVLLSNRFEPVSFDAETPLRVTEGSTVELFVENTRGALPEDLRVESRPESGGAVAADRLRRTTLRDSRGKAREVGALTLATVRADLRFRAAGGDDERMPFYRIEVVPPPLVEEFQATLTPPKYSRKDLEKLPPGVGHVQGLVGTLVDVEAKVNRPLESVRLRVKDQTQTGLELAEDGLSFRGRFTIAEAGVYSYWFELRDREGFENPEAPRYEIRGVADLVPEATIELPATDLTVVTDARIPFRVSARDDLGLKGMRLVSRLGDRSDTESRVLRLFDGEGRPAQHAADLILDLKEYEPAPGSRILVHGEATDDFDLGPEHVGRSVARVLTIVSPQEKAIELSSRQGALVDELERSVEAEKRAREQIGQLQLQLNKAGQLQPGDIDLLKRIELDQKQLASRLAGSVDSIESRSREMIRELDQNNLDDDAMRSRLEQLAEDVGRLREANLPVIEQQLTRARKAAALENRSKDESTNPAGGRDEPEKKGPESDAGKPSSSTEPRRPDGDRAEKPAPHTPDAKAPPAAKRSPNGMDDSKEHEAATPSPHEQRDALREVGEQQDIVLESLGEQLRRLSEWRSRRDITGELQELVNGQKRLNEDTAEVGRRTLGKPQEDLTAQDQADLARLADRQDRQADRTAQFRAKVGEMAKDMGGSNPDVAESLKEIQEDLRRNATAEKMRQVSDEIEKNNVGRATTGQQELIEELDQLQSSLRERPNADLEEMVKRMKRSEAELESLKDRQEELQKRTREAAQNPDAQEREAQLEQLRKEQQKLRDDTADALRRLRKQPSKNAADAARRAGQRMDQAADALDQNDGEAADDPMQEALDDLEQARQETAQERREAEMKLAQELLEQIADEIRSMVARQQGVIDELKRLSEEFARRGNWTRGQLKSLLGVSEVQKGLLDETNRLAEKIKAAEVFALALRGASRSMQTVVTRTAERKADEPTVAAAEAALKRFVALVESLKNDPTDPMGAEQQGGASGEQPDQKQDQGPPQDGIPQMAQLKMLKSLQEDLLARTAALDALRGKEGMFTVDQQKELDALALEQGELADLTRNMIRKLAPPQEAEEAKDEKAPKAK
ncbi:MAG: hypothetical protein IT428_08620 [Planctomycetaceae bacterium]|nr:hypothetical protein [Planctomycetaceae bacterium]